MEHGLVHGLGSSSSAQEELKEVWRDHSVRNSLNVRITYPFHINNFDNYSTLNEAGLITHWKENEMDKVM